MWTRREKAMLKAMGREEKSMRGKKIKTAGYGGGNKLFYDTGPWECSKIVDGVSFEHNNEGGWVIGFKDLEKIYLEARNIRIKQQGKKP